MITEYIVCLIADVDHPHPDVLEYVESILESKRGEKSTVAYSEPYPTSKMELFAKIVNR